VKSKYRSKNKYRSRSESAIALAKTALRKTKLPPKEIRDAIVAWATNPDKTEEPR
jgi:hypothetical protein